MATLVNEEWSLVIGSNTVAFFKTQLPQAEDYFDTSMAYRYGWKDVTRNVYYILVSPVAPTDAEVEATYTP